ncbi:MAG: type II toxin-antitoxin system PemK/MazF family toxin [Planctomycetes bacterium]|nr:type II toxin-antitoxin system PemK/MazF family toxin [Planctomycetota bacterium]
MSRPSRGEIWQVDLNPVIGHEQGNTRPALVVSTDQMNHGASGLVVVVPITATQHGIPLHINIKRGQGGLTKDSCILCDQIRALSIDRFIKPYETVEPAVMDAVEKRIKIVLGLR